MVSNHPDRHKRSAEQSLDDTFDRGRHAQNGATDFMALPTTNYNYASYPSVMGVYPPSSAGIPPTSSSPAANNEAPYVSSYERWPSGNASSLACSGTLSTSVLPQLYSTGLFDDRGPSSSANAGISATADQTSHHQNDRYPQYWNDYSAFSQLGTAYGQASVPPLPVSSQTFLPDQYNMYSKCFSTFIPPPCHADPSAIDNHPAPIMR
jgi:hypothetical protein